MRIGYMVVATAAVASGCNASASSQSEDPPPPAPGSVLRCADTQLSRVALDVPGPGQPSPLEAVAPHAGTLDLASRVVDGEIVVIGLRQDGSIVRTYDVTERADGWWPDGYSECRA